MKDWEDIIKERQLGRKAELPESDWNDFLSRKAEHERAAKRSRMLILTGISVPAAAAILLLLFLMPFKTVAPDNQLAQNEPSEPQVLADSITAPIENVMFPAQLAVVAKVLMVNDTTKFNMATYKLPEGASDEDLIRKLPGLKIDSAGNITVNGKSLSRILVNDKELFNDDKTKELTQLTADMIEKVKAYEKQSDLSRQTDIDDGEEEQVLDLNYESSISGVTSTFKTPLIVFDGNVVEVDKDRLAAFDFSKSYNDRDSLSSLLGVRRGKINVIRAVQGVEAFKEWGPKGLNGVLEVFSGKYYRKSLRAGKLDGGPYEIVPRSKHTR